MIRLGNGLFIDGGTYSVPCHATPQWASYDNPEKQPNGDFAQFNGAGLFVADGVGKEHMPWVASQTAVKAATYRALELEVPRMPMDEALDAVKADILPFVDYMIARQVQKHPEATGTATTLEALFVAYNGLVVVGAGDSLSLGWRPRQPLDFVRLTREQELEGMITNKFDGQGRPEPGVPFFDERTKEPLPAALTHDEVRAVPPEPGDIYFGMTDGVFGGNHQATRMPQTPQFMLGSLLHAPTAAEAAENLVTLPYRLWKTNLLVYSNGEWLLYHPPMDDASAGVLRVHASE